MDIHEAAYIIGSMGGRPLKNPFQYPIYRRGGGFSSAAPANAYQTEDLLFFYTDETGLNFYVTET